MIACDVGDRVRIDIPDETDPDHRYHGQHGEIVCIVEDAADKVTGRERDASLFRIELDTGERVDLRRRDLRPPLDE